MAENSALAQQEFNRAFVLMQYFGYLRRNPNDAPDGNFAGYNFWLDKLNQFDGNFIQAEMVKAFLSSIEYRTRFGPCYWSAMGDLRSRPLTALLFPARDKFHGGLEQ